MIDWEDLRYKGDPADAEASRPVEMTQEESIMSNDVEELSEDMRRENDLAVRKTLGKTSLAFIDLENMSMGLQLFFLVTAVGIFSAIGLFFYNALFKKEVSAAELHKEKVMVRRSKKNE